MVTKKKAIAVDDDRQHILLELPERVAGEIAVKRIDHPLWTENKAKLIERYLFLFALVTKHGTYIDCFAGPQQPGKPEMWAAKLVLDNRPALIRNFHLCEIKKTKVNALESLR